MRPIHKCDDHHLFIAGQEARLTDRAYSITPRPTFLRDDTDIHRPPEFVQLEEGDTKPEIAERLDDYEGGWQRDGEPSDYSRAYLLDWYRSH